MADETKLEGKVDALSQSVDLLKTDVAVLKTDILEVKVGQRRLESDVKQLQVSVTDMQSSMTDMREDIDGLRRNQSSMISTLEDVSLNQRSLTAAVVEALTQLNLSRTFEKRLQRLEDKVFGPGV